MLRVIQIGVGPVGQRVVQYAVERDGVEVVAAVDPSPELAGKDLGEACRIDAMGVKIAKDLKTALNGKQADAAMITTVSGIEAIESQIVEIAEAGISMVTTCEELSFPWVINPQVTKRIDKVCQQHGVVCLATGVNPGFLMDYLPSVLSSICQNVESIEVSRIQDASVRRLPFQKKIGAGLSRAEFEQKVTEGIIRHVGLPESVYMIAHMMGWDLDQVTESIKPVIAEKKVTSGYMPIEEGVVRGVEQIGLGKIGENEVIRLTFRAAVGEPKSVDFVEITGEPSFKSVIDGGINGDIATCAITLNCARVLSKVEPGFKTMLDVPVAGWFKQG
jgi:hypothetical protein